MILIARFPGCFRVAFWLFLSYPKVIPRLFPGFSQGLLAAVLQVFPRFPLSPVPRVVPSCSLGCSQLFPGFFPAVPWVVPRVVPQVVPSCSLGCSQLFPGLFPAVSQLFPAVPQLFPAVPWVVLSCSSVAPRVTRAAYSKCGLGEGRGGGRGSPRVVPWVVPSCSPGCSHLQFYNITDK